MAEGLSDTFESINRNLNITSLTDAGPEIQSESWPQSPSISRYCGSLFATGIPLVKFKERWDSLPTYAATADPESLLNRNPTIASDDEKPTTRIGSLQGRFDSVTMAANHVEMVSRMYLLSFPGRESMASNTALHGLLKKFLEKKINVTFTALTYIYDQVRFRTDLMVLATQLLESAQIRLPEEAACADFDVEAFEVQCHKYPKDIKALKYQSARGMIFTTVLPDPDEQIQGVRWNKPHRYIAAALACDDSIQKIPDLNAAFGRLEKSYSAVLAGTKQALDRDEEVRAKKNAWYRTLGKTTS